MPRKGWRKSKGVVGDPSDGRGFGVLLSRYLEWMRVQNYSDRTVGNREQYLSYFIVWCEERGVTRPNEVAKPILDRYQRYLYHLRRENGQPLSFRSQYSRLVPVRAFFKWLARHNHILYNPASELELPRLERRLPKHVLSASEAELVIGQADIHERLGIRDRAIMETLYSTGMRRMELIGLEIYDLDGDRGTVMVRQGKGKKDRMVPIGERCVAWIDKYLSDTRPSLVLDPNDRTLFLTSLGEAFTPNRLTQLVRNYVDAAAIGKRGACHLFRHTMATLMLENGADIRFIQQMLGHADLSTTQIYTQVSIRQLKQIHTATHPARWKHLGDQAASRTEEQDPIAKDPARAALLSSLAAEAEASEEGDELEDHLATR